MDIGKLKHLVSLQRPVETRNPTTGAIVKTWEEVAQVWADILYLNGSETLKSDTTISVAKASIRIRLREDVVAKWRVLHGQTVFDIGAVLPDERGQAFLDLACDTGANQG